MSSIARRVYRASFALSMASILVMVLSVMLVNEDLEQTMLKLDFASHRDFILGQHKPNEYLYWQTANLSAIYVPLSQTGVWPLPEMFEGLPDSYDGEWEEDGHFYLVNVESTNNGRLYLARDITFFEARELLFFWVLLVISSVIIGLSFLFSMLIGRRLSQPLTELSERIRQIPIGQNMPSIDQTFKDRELQAIADTFNTFLLEMKKFVKREHSFLNLASHELRTPISVILGAAEVMEQRGMLQAKDKQALLRIECAATEVQTNISAMLKLSRRDNGAESQMLLLPGLLEEVLDELSESYDVYQRVELDSVHKDEVFADPVLVKMLLRNIIQNALQHTSREVHIKIGDGVLEISDHGKGMTNDQHSVLAGRINTSMQSTLDGLGLYIVTLICERLEWSLNVMDQKEGGTIIHIHYARAED